MCPFSSTWTSYFKAVCCIITHLHGLGIITHIELTVVWRISPLEVSFVVRSRIEPICHFAFTPWHRRSSCIATDLLRERVQIGIRGSRLSTIGRHLCILQNKFGRCESFGVGSPIEYEQPVGI